MTTQPNNVEQRIERLAEQQRETHAQTMAELGELNGSPEVAPATALSKLKAISQQQLETARAQAESIRSLASAFVEQARAYREFSRGLPDVVETARRSAQASEGAAYMAQRTLEAMRDLIEELRQERG